MSGAGGVGYMVIRTAGSSAPVVLDYIGRAPAAATPDRFATENSKDDGILSPLIPGAAGGWLTALARFGTLDRATVFAPAIDLAENGFAVTIKQISLCSIPVIGFATGDVESGIPSRR